MIPECSRNQLIEAMRRFDGELRPTDEWREWEKRAKYKYAIRFEEALYPVKMVISMATGQPRNTFSGGPEANSYVRKRDLDVVLIGGSGVTLRKLFETVLANYVLARTSEPLKGHSLYATLKQIAETLRAAEAVSERATLKVEPSAGQGQWAKVPWVALLDSRDTKTTQRGVYCVYLFREDMSGVYVTLNQGVTESIKQRGTAAGRAHLRENSVALRARSGPLVAAGFRLDDGIDLRCSGGLGVDYEYSTVAYKLYEAGAVPADEELLADLESLLGVYDDYLTAKPPPADEAFLPTMRRYCDEGIVFQSAAQGVRYFVESVDASGCTVKRVDGGSAVRCSKDEYDRAVAKVREAGGRLPRRELAADPAIRTVLRQGMDLSLSADRQFAIDVADPTEAVTSLVEVLNNLRVNAVGGNERPYKPTMVACVLEAISSGELTTNRIEFKWLLPRYLRKLAERGIEGDAQQAAYPFFHLTSDLFWMLAYRDPSRPLEAAAPDAIDSRVRYATIKDRYWEILQDAQTRDVVLREFLPRWGFRPEGNETAGFAEIVDSFSFAVQGANLSFGEQHRPLLRSFLAALAAKRLAILTGLSGSGKTQLGLALGNWFGPRRQLVLPVRPDWTGPEALLGYPDALQAMAGGCRAWQVPEALAFVLRAAADPVHPYLLLLDEMNLAHVERYFADVLSGMESNQPCIPNVAQGEDGIWRESSPPDDKLVFPRNLFVVGTVNVDETTYMFSPKVLDRANTFEFRVTAADLSVDLQRPTVCAAGAEALVRSYLRLAIDDRYQDTHPASGRDELAKNLTALHEVLSTAGFEFGHRVFYEALRFAAYLEAGGEGSSRIALDRIVAQKILPRLHGSYRRIHGLLCVLAQFAYELPSGAGELSGESFDPEPYDAARAQLPVTFDKLQRMTRSVRANQFVSFAE